MKQLIRGLGSEYMNHPLFYFWVNFFEGVNLDSDNEELNEKDTSIGANCFSIDV